MIKILKIDQTQFWEPQFLKKFKISRIFGVYVFDSAIRVHACEIAPSFECHFVESQAEYPQDMQEEQREQMLEEILEADPATETVSYYHVSVVMQMVPFKRGFFPPKGKSGVLAIRGGWSEQAMRTRDKERRRGDLIEEALEYCRQNSV